MAIKQKKNVSFFYKTLHIYNKNSYGFKRLIRFSIKLLIFTEYCKSKLVVNHL